MLMCRIIPVHFNDYSCNLLIVKWSASLTGRCSLPILNSISVGFIGIHGINIFSSLSHWVIIIASIKINAMISYINFFHNKLGDAIFTCK